MKITTRLFLAGWCAITVPACDGIFGNDDDNFTFSAQQTEFTEGMVNSAEVSAVLRSIQIDGIFLLPHPCHSMSGSLRRTQSGTVEVVITARPTSTCQPAVQAMDYRLQTLGFARGPYRVLVYHQIQGQPRELVAEENITVE